MIASFPCAFSPWIAGIGDRGLAAWFIVALYLVAAFASARTARSAALSPPARRSERAVWWICTAVLALLAINKQLDLQTLLTSAARCVALDQGWYENRRVVQRRFIIFVAVAGIVVVAACVVLLRKSLPRAGLVIVGLGFVCTFVAIRAASFHHVDILLNRTVLGLPLAQALEIPGPVLILAVALRARRSAPS